MFTFRRQNMTSKDDPRAERVTNLNPLSPHDALKHHFISLKTYLIFLQLRRVLEQNFHETGLPIHKYMAVFFNF